MGSMAVIPGLPPQVAQGSNFWLISRIYKHISITTTSKCVQENVAYQVSLRSESSGSNYQIFKSSLNIPKFPGFTILVAPILSRHRFFLIYLFIRGMLKSPTAVIAHFPCNSLCSLYFETCYTCLLATNTFRIRVSTFPPKKWTLLSLCNVSISGFSLCIEIYFA